MRHQAVLSAKSYTRIDDFQVVVYSAIYPSVVESKLVFFSLEDTKGTWTTEIALQATEVCLPDKETKFTISKPRDFGEVKNLKIRFCDGSSVDQFWFVNRVTVSPSSLISAVVAVVETKHFPLRRWITSSKSNIFAVGDCLLPQHDENIEQRNQELEEIKNVYRNVSSGPGQPLMV